MKCCFIKTYDKPDPDQVQHFDTKSATKSEDTVETSDRHDKLEEEVLKLKSIIVCLEETIVQQKHVIEEKSVQLKNSEKSAEDKAAEFREEVLRVKREKNKHANKIKALEDENVMLKNQKENLKKEEQKLLEEKQILVSEVKTLKADQATHGELTQSLEQRLKKESESPKHQCDDCDQKARTQGGLRKHQQAHHSHSKGMQWLW